MNNITSNEQSKVFPIVMSKQMAKTLKQVALQQDRSASDIVRVLLSGFLLSEAKNHENQPVNT